MHFLHDVTINAFVRMLIPNAVAFVCFFSSEIWSELAISLRDSTLRELATTSLPSLLMSAKASSTTKKYLANWARWESWASSKIDVPVFPVDPIHFSLYIAHLATTGPKTIAESVAAAVKWVHSLTALPSPDRQHDGKDSHARLQTPALIGTNQKRTNYTRHFSKDHDLSRTP